MSKEPACKTHSYLPGPPPCSICLAEQIEAEAKLQKPPRFQPREEVNRFYEAKQEWMTQEMERRLQLYRQSRLLDILIEMHDKGLSGSGES